MKKALFLLLFIIGCFSLMSSDNPSSGVGIRFGSFGIPNQLLDMFIYEHPKVQGSAFSFEIRSYGNKGPKSVFSGVYSFEYNKMKGEGNWRMDQTDRPLVGSGEITQFCVTATILLNLFPSFPVHPYVGAGIGLGKVQIWAEGIYEDEVGTQIKDSFVTNKIIPVGHLPVGIVVNIKNQFEIRFEAGFKNGFYFSGGLTYIFIK